jgi:hypothetical protein
MPCRGSRECSQTRRRARVVGNKESLLLRLIGESGNMGIWRKHLLDKVKGDISQAEFKKILEVCAQ